MSYPGDQSTGRGNRIRVLPSIADKCAVLQERAFAIASRGGRQAGVTRSNNATVRVNMDFGLNASR